LDGQNAWEKMMTAAAVICSQANILMNAGMFASGLTISHEQLVIDNEILGFLYHLRKGIEVTPETLAIKNIQEAGLGGNFLHGDLQFARRRLKKEYWTPDISCRLDYDRWVGSGARNSMVIAKERVHKILENHKSVDLDANTKKSLDEIVADFKQAT
jgi:trimethylamine--corrinoid protein Co-methyltransferase